MCHTVEFDGGIHCHPKPLKIVPGTYPKRRITADDLCVDDSNTRFLNKQMSWTVVVLDYGNVLSIKCAVSRSHLISLLRNLAVLAMALECNSFEAERCIL